MYTSQKTVNKKKKDLKNTTQPGPQKGPCARSSTSTHLCSHDALTPISSDSLPDPDLQDAVIQLFDHTRSAVPRISDSQDGTGGEQKRLARPQPDYIPEQS